jgi:hypothetical protein
MRRTASLSALVSVALVVSSCGGLTSQRGSMEVWLIPARQPRVRVTVTRGCPTSVSRYRDVQDPGADAHDRLVPLDPRDGLICRYGPRVLSSGSGESGPELYRSTSLDRSRADELARVIDDISTAGPGSGPPPACPEDSGSASIIAFAYVSGPDADLWYGDAGCQILDNGTIGAWEVGNPSFYDGFISTIDALSPLQT